MNKMNKMNKKRKLNFFSEHEVAFRKELGEHPELLRAIAVSVPVDSKGERDEGQLLGCVLYYLGIEVDEVMTRSEVERLYSALTHKLRKIRTSTIIH